MMTFLNRIWMAIKIDVSLFKEIKNNNNLVWQGFSIAILTAIANALVAKTVFSLTPLYQAPTIILILIWVFLNWYVLSKIMHLLASKIFSEKKERRIFNKQKNILSGIGYSYAPELLKFTVIIYPNLFQAVSFGTFVWVIACQVVFIKILFNFKSAWRSLGIVILSYIIQILLVFIFMLIVYYLANPA